MTNVDVWRAPFADGWNPQISPDGKYILCGSGHGHVVDWKTKTIIALPEASYASGWLNPTQAVIMIGGDVSRVHMIAAPAFVPTLLLAKAFNFHGAGGNRWAGGDTREIWSGGTTPGGIKIADGYAATVDETGIVVYSINVHTSARLQVWNSTGPLRTITPAYSPSRFLCGAGGYVGYGYSGPAWINTPANINQDLSVTPEKQESPPLAFRHNGAVWIVTSSDRGIFIRPLGVLDRAIQLDLPAVDVAIVSLGDRFLVAVNSDKGVLRVCEVPATAALEPVEPIGPPEPPADARPKITIASYAPTSGPVPLTVRAIWARQTGSGPVEEIDWLQKVDGASVWEVVATNPASDRDHHYKFETPGGYRIGAKARGPGGIGQTSDKRLVTATGTEPEPPEPEPPPPDAATLTLQADGGPFVSVVDDAGTIRATGTEAGPAETFTPERQADGRLALKSSRGRYVSAEDGNGILTANREAIGPWERFTVRPQGAGRITLDAEAGGYVSALDGGGRELVANRDAIGPWEIFRSTYTPPTAPARTGLVRASGRRFVDDGGPFLPLGGSLFWAMRGWKFERDRLKQNVDYLARYGFDYMRILAQVGWSGNTISEAWPDHVAILGEVIDYAYSVGVRTQITGIGGGSYNADRVIDNVIAATRGREHKVIYVEIANEWWSNFEEGETKLKALGARVRKALPNLVALSAPREELATERNAGWVADKAASMGTMHLDRTDKKSDWKWRHVRKPWESRNPKFPESHGEPGGPLSSVASFMEPIHLVMSRAVGIVCGVEAYCLHNGAGVGGQVDPAHHRPANLWEVPGIDRIMETVRALDGVLPAAPSNGTATRTGISGHPLTADQFWPDHSEYDHGVVRDYARRNGRTFWQALQGIKNYVNLKADKAYRLTFIDPVTRAKHERTVGAGKTIKVERGSVDTRSLGAWIVRGVE